MVLPSENSHILEKLWHKLEAILEFLVKKRNIPERMFEKYYLNWISVGL